MTKRDSRTLQHDPINPVERKNQERRERTMKYRPEILAHGETTWANNSIECETYEEAAASARRTFMNWFAADTWRVVTTDTPKRQPYVPGSEDPDAPPR